MKQSDARTLLQDGEIQEALRLLRELVKEGPDLVGNVILLAQTLEAVGDVEQARRTWGHALQLVPNSPVARQAFERLSNLPPRPRPQSEGARKSIPAPKVRRVTSEERDEAPSTERRSVREDDPQGGEDLESLIADLTSGSTTDSQETDTQRTEPDIATETLARIYATQGEWSEAIRVYEMLARRAQSDEEARRFQDEARKLGERIKSSGPNGE